MTAGYDALADLAERELELVAAGAVDELPALHARRSALVAALPAAPPPAARPALERAAQLQQLVTDVLEEHVRDAGGELRRVARGRTAMHGYAPHAEPAKLVDRAG
jgi:hypothetical protein